MVASLVAILDVDPNKGIRTLLEFASKNSTVEVGERSQNRVPIVLEAPTADEISLLTREIGGLHGILHVDVVFSSLEI